MSNGHAMTLSSEGAVACHVANPSEAAERMTGEKRRRRPKARLLGVVAILARISHHPASARPPDLS